MEFFLMFVKLILGLIVIIALIALSVKLSSKKITNFTNKKYVRVIDRIQISKDSYIVITKIGDKGIVFVTSGNSTQKLEELTSEEVTRIETEKRESIENVSKEFDRYIKIVKEKASILLKKKSKEEKDEK